MHRSSVKNGDSISHAVSEKLMERLGMRDIQALNALDLVEPQVMSLFKNATDEQRAKFIQRNFGPSTKNLPE